MSAHDLRHTHVALCIEAGVHVKTIQARLGHASISTTMNIYGHLLDGVDEAAALALDSLQDAGRTRALRVVEG